MDRTIPYPKAKSAEEAQANALHLATFVSALREPRPELIEMARMWADVALTMDFMELPVEVADEDLPPVVAAHYPTRMEYEVGDRGLPMAVVLSSGVNPLTDEATYVTVSSYGWDVLRAIVTRYLASTLRGVKIVVSPNELTNQEIRMQHLADGSTEVYLGPPPLQEDRDTVNG